MRNCKTLIGTLVLSSVSWAHAADTLPLTAEQIAAAGIQTVALDQVSALGSSVNLHGLVSLSPGAATGISVTHEASVKRIESGNLSSVKAGQNVLQLHSREWLIAQQEFLKALAEATFEGQNLMRDKGLIADGLIPERRLQDQTNRSRIAGAALDSARQNLVLMGADRSDIQNLEKTGRLQPNLMIKAPTAGQVSGLNVKVGQTLSAGEMLFQVVDASKLEMNLSANSIQASRISAGDSVSVIGCPTKGTVIGVGLELDSESQSVPVRVKLDNSANQCLKANQIVQAAVQSKNSGNATGYLVPANSVITQDGAQWVFARQQDGFLPVQVDVLGQDKGKLLVQAKNAPELQAGVEVANAGTVMLKGVWAGLGGE